MRNIDKLAKKFGLEEYVDFKIELGSIYISDEDDFGRKFWLHFAETLGYRGDTAEMMKDIKNALNK